MAFTPYHAIIGTGGITQELIKPGDNIKPIKSILVTNTHASASCDVTLFIQDNPRSGTASTFKIISAVTIPADVSLLIDNKALLSFSGGIYGLYVTLGAATTNSDLDIFINT